MKNFLILSICVLAAWGVQARENREQPITWNAVKTGFVSSNLYVRQVTLAEDKTDVTMCYYMSKGRGVQLSPQSFLQVGDRQYKVRESSIGLGENYTLTADSVIFTATFEPVPLTTTAFDFVEPDGWMICKVRERGGVTANGIDDTYWRDATTGEWLLGIAADAVIVGGEVCPIVNRSERKDVFTLTLADGRRICIGKAKKGAREITIGQEKPVTCIQISRGTLSDYPTHDESDFADSGYRSGDSATVSGWLKGLPRAVCNGGLTVECHVGNFLKDEEETFVANADSLGRFEIKLPLLNTAIVYFSAKGFSFSAVLVPGERYFFLYDYAMGQKFWMGRDVRLQNEMLAHPLSRLPIHDIALNNETRKRGELDAVWVQQRCDSVHGLNLARAQQFLDKHPMLSRRYTTFVRSCIYAYQLFEMMQARYDVKNRELPQEYISRVAQLKDSVATPYTLTGSFYSSFVRDYFEQLRPDVNAYRERSVRRLANVGAVTLSEAERATLEQYAVEHASFLLTIRNGGRSYDEIIRMYNEFDARPISIQFDSLCRRIDAQLKLEMPLDKMRCLIDVADSLSIDSNLRDLVIARLCYYEINWKRMPLDSVVVALANAEIKNADIKALVNELNEKYIALVRRDISQSPCLRPNSDVEGLTDGEQILRKILEPYKGRIVYLDVWGTWCSPCKKKLKESPRVKKALADLDIVYLYLCNHSTDESWKNVIKEYDLLDDNCVHYNLPTEQQAAVERFIKLTGYPTYRLIDREGGIHELHWLHTDDMKKFRKTIENLK
ncbi:MAG: hypothetical protein K6E73_08015 [Bacteroidales bacterium]|nr:hypothetical protein [Bacteroidales bacterium]